MGNGCVSCLSNRSLSVRICRGLALLVILAASITVVATGPSVLAQPQNHWFVTIGGSSNEGAYGVAYDGTYLYVTGYTESYGGLDDDIFLAKLDLNGNVEWYKVIDTSDNSWGRRIVYSGGYLYLTGYFNNEVFLAKL